MSTMITDAAVEAAHDAYWRTPDNRGEDRPAIRAALEAALPHLAVFKQDLIVAQGEADCPACNGSGESTAWAGSGPDVYEVDVPCGVCDGTGVAPEAGNPVSADDFAREAIAYSHNFATAKPDIGATEKQHILGLCKVVERLLAARQPVCSNCNGVGVIPYTSGQTAESFEQGEYPCPECAACQPVGEPSAWAHEGDPTRVISANQKASALRDKGASGSSVRPYSVPLYAAPPAQQPVLGDSRKVWPFVESPGEFTERLRVAMQEFPLLGAVRNILIENPPTLVAQQPAQVDLGALKHAAHEWANLSACAAAKRGGPWRAHKAAAASRDAAKKRFLSMIDSQGNGNG